MKYLDANTSRLARSLKLGLRSYTSACERSFHERDSRLVDLITAMEAILHLDEELSFKISFRVAGLLGKDDDHRVRIYTLMRTYYETRSVLVHGSEIKPKHRESLERLDLLEDFVRRLLVGFIHLDKQKELFDGSYKHLDASIQHDAKRQRIRRAMLLA